ncbi:MAG: hypothetical protein ACU0FT_08060 [Paracoccus sp. (in: a-proteobacteria)]
MQIMWREVLRRLDDHLPALFLIGLGLLLVLFWGLAIYGGIHLVRGSLG